MSLFLRPVTSSSCVCLCVSVLAGVVEQVVSLSFGGFAVAIGLIDSTGNLTLAPGIVEKHKWVEGDMLVIIRRDIPAAPAGTTKAVTTLADTSARVKNPFEALVWTAVGTSTTTGAAASAKGRLPLPLTRLLPPLEQKPRQPLEQNLP